MTDSDLIFYQFTRMKVERGDFSDFLSLYARDKLPAGRRLREMMDRFVFCIDGYDDDSREIHAIPEIRHFYSAFHNAWPYWFYFCELETDVLRSMVLCCLPSISSMQVDGKDEVAVTYNPLEIVSFLKTDLVSMNGICDRAEMFEHLIYARTKRVFEYFGLAFDAPSPNMP